MNVIAISGNLTAEPELKTTQNGLSVCSFTVAVKRPHTKDKTDFIDCVAWKEKAEFLTRYFRKGSRVEVAGHIETRIYGQEGAKRKATELICEDISFGGKKEDGNESQDAPAPSYSSAPSEGNFEEISGDDDLPF